MKKKLVLMMSMLLWLGMFSACSSSDDTTDFWEGRDPTVNSDGRNNDKENRNNDNVVTANYHLLDKNGRETSAFNYGDEILFELIVKNSTNHTLKFEDWRMLVRDAFIVYNSEGQMFNPIPNSVLLMYPVTIEPGEQFCRQLIWPWAIVPLPSGKYYSICTLNVDEKSNNIYTVNFEIK